MKKLIAVALFAGAAITCQAACVDWQYYDNSESGDQVGYTVYAIAGAIQTNWASVDAVKAAAMKQGGSAVIEDMGRAGFLTEAVTASSDALTKESGYFLVVVNTTEDKFGVVAGNSGAVYDPSKQESSGGTFDAADVATTISFSGEPGPIPEPTTGLLLIIGVAGLALRRNSK